MKKLVNSIEEIKKEIENDSIHYYVDVVIERGAWVKSYYITLDDNGNFVVEEYLQGGEETMSAQQLQNSEIGEAIKNKNLFFVDDDEDSPEGIGVVIDWKEHKNES